MAADGPAKTDIQTIFKKLRSVPTNKQCFDCSAQNPTWASVTYGVFLCIDCSAVHRGLGVHLTFIRSTQLDTNWTWLQLRAMQVGGNAAAIAFFRQHGCTTTDAQQKYNSRAAAMYREKLHASACKAMKQYGTKAIIDVHGTSDATSPITKEIGFFDDITSLAPAQVLGSGNVTEAMFTTPPIPVRNSSQSQLAQLGNDLNGPNVEAALSMSPTQAALSAEPRKPTIGARKPTAAKKGMGAKKGGLGAQKVQADFSEIETQAQERDRQKEQLSSKTPTAETKDKDKEAASVRLAYQELSIESKKAEERMKNLDPKKREQMERLGMGMTGSRGISHSALTDMKTIEQENPGIPKNNSYERFSNTRNNRDIEDDFDMLGFSGPSKYSERYSDNGRFGESKDHFKSTSSDRSWDVDRFDNKTSNEFFSMQSKDDDEKCRVRKASYDVPVGDDAQKKFGNAKSISSDQYFGGRDTDFEVRSNLQRFEGSTGISSADYFGSGTNNRSSDRSMTELNDIREGVRTGVAKVAGKLSTLANGVMNSIQKK